MAINAKNLSIQASDRTSAVCRFEWCKRNILEAKGVVIHEIETPKASKGANLPIVGFEGCFHFLLKTSLFVDFF